MKNRKRNLLINSGRRVKYEYKKKRRVVDAESSLNEVIKHSLANFSYGLTSGLVISAMIIGDLWILIGIYLIHKKNEVVTIPRMQYTSKLGKNYLYPLPSTAGFACSYLLSEYIKTLI